MGRGCSIAYVLADALKKLRAVDATLHPKKFNEDKDLYRVVPDTAVESEHLCIYLSVCLPIDRSIYLCMIHIHIHLSSYVLYVYLCVCACVCVWRARTRAHT